MKRIMILFLVIMILWGCSSQKTVEQKQLELYEQVRNDLIHQTVFDDNYPFNISLTYTELDDGLRYDIIIDQPTKTMFDIQALCYAGETDQQICPTVGLFDDDIYHLKANYIDKKNGFYKGVMLSGKVKDKNSVKVYIKYSLDENRSKNEEMYIEVK